jgi:hypothetical protein
MADDCCRSFRYCDFLASLYDRDERIQVSEDPPRHLACRGQAMKGMTQQRQQRPLSSLQPQPLGEHATCSGDEQKTMSCPCDHLRCLKHQTVIDRGLMWQW